MKPFFDGMYFKHQINDSTLALIPGRTHENAFIQVISNNSSHYFAFPLSEYEKSGGRIIIGENLFSAQGITLNLAENGFALSGALQYSSCTPLSRDIMGPFRFLPLECRHSITSLHHELSGGLLYDGKFLSFDGGVGYIEGDRGSSFPKQYTWVQSNCFDGKCSIVASAAKIPIGGLSFMGCICVIYIVGTTYLLASYRGARVTERTAKTLKIRQGKLQLHIEVEGEQGHALYAPQKGKMERTIRESASVAARFRLTNGSELILDKISPFSSYEYV